MDLFWERVHMPDRHGYDRNRPFLSSFLRVFSCINQQSLQSPLETFAHLSSEHLLRAALRRHPQWLELWCFLQNSLWNLVPSATKSPLGNEGDRVCRRQLAKVLLPHKNTAFFLLGGYYSVAPSWKYRTAPLDSCTCDILTWGFQPSSMYDCIVLLCNLPSLCHYTTEVPHGPRCWTTAFVFGTVLVLQLKVLRRGKPFSGGQTSTGDGHKS